MALSFDSLTAAQIAAGVAVGDFTATEVAQASLAAIEAREGGVQAFLQVAPELALEAAARVDADRAAGKPLPPLAGVPLAIKDNMNLVGTRTTCASRMLENYQSVYTATCVQRMLDAGCLPMGKANMDEFAFGSSTESSAFHRTNNPWDTERVPGGSSGGSAAAVAAADTVHDDQYNGFLHLYILHTCWFLFIRAYFTSFRSGLQCQFSVCSRKICSFARA